jgi:hypothetical protein
MPKDDSDELTPEDRAEMHRDLMSAKIESRGGEPLDDILSLLRELADPGRVDLVAERSRASKGTPRSRASRLELSRPGAGLAQPSAFRRDHATPPEGLPVRSIELWD